MAIGFIESYKYKLGKVELQEGDVLIYYTDGISEAENNNKVLYGIDRIKSLVEAYNYLDAESIKDLILKSVEDFREAHEQVDDITLLVIKI